MHFRKHTLLIAALPPLFAVSFTPVRADGPPAAAASQGTVILTGWLHVVDYSFDLTLETHFMDSWRASSLENYYSSY